MVAAVTGSFLREVPGTTISHQDVIFWIGIALMLAGIAIRATAILTLRRFFTVRVMIQEGHQLVEHGVYSMVRHPSYSGALVSFVGLGLAFGNWLSLIVIAGAALAAFSYRIHVEEQALLAHFGDRYRQYAAHTRRLIPGIY